MAAKRCPNCNLVNPGSARSCDCGYSFADGSVGAPLDLAKRDHQAPMGPMGQMLARRMIGILILIGVGILIALVKGLGNMF